MLIDLHVQLGNKTFIMGDEVNVATETPQLQVRVVGSAPIEHVAVRNGAQVIKQLRSYGNNDLGRRIKIVWRGARERGRDRLVRWNGRLHIQNNSIISATPLNFWDANHPLESINEQQLAWQSVTTGGTAGVILTLAKAEGPRKKSPITITKTAHKIFFFITYSFLFYGLRIL